MNSRHWGAPHYSPMLIFFISLSVITIILRLLCAFSPKIRSKIGFLFVPRRRRGYYYYEPYTQADGYCPKCGNGVESDSNFCRHCGHKL